MKNFIKIVAFNIWYGICTLLWFIITVSLSVVGVIIDLLEWDRDIVRGIALISNKCTDAYKLAINLFHRTTISEKVIEVSEENWEV